MIRFLTLTAILIGALWLSQTPLHAQDADLPVAGPNEIIILGEVPDAPPGTDVWAFYFDGEFFPCGSTTTDDDSRFVLVVDADCSTPPGPNVCWGELPDWKEGPEELCDASLSAVWFGDPPDAGETVDMGLLVRTLVPGALDPVDDYPRLVDFPVAGPDEIIFIGEIPAPPGTSMWAMYLVDEIVSCGTTQADEESRFILIVDAACPSGLGPVICWGAKPDWTEPEEFCDGRYSLPLSIKPHAGDTVNVGPLLPLSERPPRASEGEIVPPHGDGVTNVSLPVTGLRQTPDGGTQVLWLAIAILLAAALLAGTGSLLLRRTR